MPEIFVAHEEELHPGGRVLVEADRTEIGVFNVEGEYFALRNRCPHLAGPICRGKLKSTMVPSEPGEFVLGLEGRVLECPWHRWEFDITSGRLVVEDARYELQRYEVRNREGSIYVIASSCLKVGSPWARFQTPRSHQSSRQRSTTGRWTSGSTGTTAGAVRSW